MMDHNSLAENVLVTAHVIGHADFVKRNELFARFMRMAGGHILEQSAARAHSLENALLRHGQEAVEAVLDAALALEPHIDVHQPLYRAPYPESADAAAAPESDTFRQRYQALPGETAPAPPPPPAGRRAIPPYPEQDLLWFIARHAPELKDWERDILLAVREEAFYFFPVHACQIMNEGWASYWHACLLREAEFLPHDLYLQALRVHSDVVRPYGNEQQLALAINPYHLGFVLWEDIIAREGLEVARRICAEEDDFGFIRNHLSAALAEKLDLFSYQERHDGETRVLSRNIHEVREAILGPKYNYGAPSIVVERMNDDASLVLRHDHARDGRGLDLSQAEQVMHYVARIWRRPVTLHTVDFRGTPRSVEITPPDAARTSAKRV
ncbi:SpoVR family protein [Duganella sp. P38]|uniref:SpoVR family protein n=1 Tax=Duganella sp. P38 TaxID=3423949 RepID=UPI003D7AD573